MGSDACERSFEGREGQIRRLSCLRAFSALREHCSVHAVPSLVVAVEDAAHERPRLVDRAETRFPIEEVAGHTVAPIVQEIANDELWIDIPHGAAFGRNPRFTHGIAE